MHFKLAMPISKLIACGAIALLISPLFAQTSANGECTATLNGQSIRVDPTGSYRIANVPAGPDLHRVEVVCRPPGMPAMYGRSAAFPVLNGQTYAVAPITLSSTPPVQAVSLRAAAASPVLTAPGAMTQVNVTATFSDGSLGIVSARSSGSSYASSNPAIAAVDEEGLVSAVADGAAFITVRNEGATAVARVDVSLGDPLTTVIGFVYDAGGNPVSGAIVSLQPVAGSGISNARGMFQIPGVLSKVGNITACAEAGGGQLAGCGPPALPMPGGLTDAGVVVVLPASSNVWVARSEGAGGSVDTIDVASKSVVATVPLSQPPGKIAASPDGTVGAVVVAGGVCFYDLASSPPMKTRVWSNPSGRTPSGVKVTSRGLAVAGEDGVFGGSSLFVIDISSGQGLSSVGTGHPFIGTFDATRDGSFVVVPDASASLTPAVASYAIDAGGMARFTGSKALLAGGFGLGGTGVITIAPDGSYALVYANGNIHTVSIDAVGQLQVLSATALSFGGADAIAVNDDISLAYVLENGGAIGGRRITEATLDPVGFLRFTARAPVPITLFGGMDLTAGGGILAVTSGTFAQEWQLILIDTAAFTVNGSVPVTGTGGAVVRLGR